MFPDCIATTIQIFVDSNSPSFDCPSDGDHPGGVAREREKNKDLKALKNELKNVKFQSAKIELHFLVVTATNLKIVLSMDSIFLLYFLCSCMVALGLTLTYVVG